jgi:hypothetical protein
MTDTGPTLGNTSLYRFLLPGEIEIETREASDDDAAAAYARELSKAREAPVIIKRRDHVDWEYVTEVDERP